MVQTKISIIGAGNVGSTTAQRLFEKAYADIILVDVVEGMPQGKALDIFESGPLYHSDVSITGSNSYQTTRNSDIVIITAGIARKPGMSRDDLLLTNANIVSTVVKNVITESPNCILLVVSNPLDAMVHAALSASGFPRERTFGMAGVLDTARFRTFIAEELSVSVNDVHAFVLGGHGDTMVPLTDYSNVAGISLNKIIPKSKLDKIVQRTRDGGAEIVKLLKTGSAYYAPSASIVEMIDSIVLDKNRILPSCVLLKGEYGITDLCLGVPTKIGHEGIKEIIELELSEQELKELHSSSESVKELLQIMNSA